MAEDLGKLHALATAGTPTTVEEQMEKMRLGRGDIVPFLEGMQMSFETAAHLPLPGASDEEKRRIALNSVLLVALELGYDWRGVVELEKSVGVDDD